MSKLILLFQSKVALAIIGALVFGGGAAWAVSMPLTPSSPGSQSANTRFQTQAGAQGTGNATATPGATAPGSASSATPVPTSTRPPKPTATPGTAGGQSITLSGTVGTVNTSDGTFTINLTGGGTKTVVVTGNTTFSGDAKSLSALSHGLPVDVKGVPQPDGTVTATDVNADNGL